MLWMWIEGKTGIVTHVRGFEHLVRNCRNRGMGMNRRMEVDQDSNSNLNGEGGLGSPN